MQATSRQCCIYTDIFKELKQIMVEKFLIIGQGRIGKPLSLKLADTYAVHTVARSHHQYDNPAICLHQKDAATLHADELMGVTHLVIIIAPNKARATANHRQAYQESYWRICRHLADLAADSRWRYRLKQVLFVSSTAVYGENAGETINENTPAVPTTPTAQILLDSEKVLQQAFGKKAVIVRAAGIYHHASTRLIDQARQAYQHGVPSHHYTNRIFADDLVNVLYQIVLTDQPKPIYLACDGVSVSSFELLAFLATRLGFLPPACMISPPTGKKIVPNIDTGLLQFANYQAGYDEIIKNLTVQHNKKVP
ncbi:Nucleoside-diphosphate-sugar epimerase [Moraxella cuniculi DSM 21768]|uniref:Nucleoside-diphosphate-sugar epimerase n=2 Tax=Moraxella cuniculi TaxID=34061 RepID=A0A1N7FWU1_9GAMM|nr:Nucleoside-diphosphate-sugar epimerase [Moraxella cuniculi DSM 21768]